MAHPPEERISEYLDGDLPESEAAELEEHLRRCPRCSGLHNDLRDLSIRARALPDREPARDLWPRIEEAILRSGSEEPQVIRLHPQVPGTAASSSASLRLSAPQAVAAGLALALFSGALGAFVADQPSRALPADPGTRMAWIQEIDASDPGLESSAREVARLEEVLARHRDELDPGTAEILEQNLRIIDEAIRESLAALREDPGNAFLRDHLARKIRAKEDYLREATLLVAPQG